METLKNKTGKSLEKLIEHLERVLTENPNTTIHAPGKLKDKITGVPREFDVLITIKNGYHEVRIGIECRDRNRKIDGPQVESFKTKCDDTDVNQGIIVSTKGFFQPAIEKAKRYGIECYTLEQVLSLNWLLARDLISFSKDITGWKFEVDPSEQLYKPMKEYAIVDEDGNEISLENLKNDVYPYIVQHNILPVKPISNKTRILILGVSFFLKDKETGKKIEIKKLFANVTYKITTKSSPFTFNKYFNAGTKTDIAEVAIVPINVGNTSGKIWLHKKQGEGIKLSFIPDKNNKRKKID